MMLLSDVNDSTSEYEYCTYEHTVMPLGSVSVSSNVFQHFYYRTWMLMASTKRRYIVYED